MLVPVHVVEERGCEARLGGDVLVDLVAAHLQGLADSGHLDVHGCHASLHEDLLNL